MTDNVAATPSRAADHEATLAQRKVNTALSLTRVSAGDEVRRSGTCAHVGQKVSKADASKSDLFWHSKDLPGDAELAGGAKAVRQRRTMKRRVSAG